jgi:acyl-ACP thioesterase
MLVEEPTSGRVFRGSRRVRLGDVDLDGRLRLDAVARYLQDVSNDDTRDAALADDGSWVVRRTEVVVAAKVPRLGERVELATWCGGTGSRWAERRVSVMGARGSRVEAASLWVHVDLRSMVPKRLPASFLSLYGEAAGGRTVGSKLTLPAAPPEGAAVVRRPWPLRRTDFDVLGHVNNAAYWAAVEEVVGERPELVTAPHRAVVEFARAIEPGADVELVVAHDEASVSLWLQVAGTTHAAATLSLSLPPSGNW